MLIWFYPNQHPGGLVAKGCRRPHPKAVSACQISSPVVTLNFRCCVQGRNTKVSAFQNCGHLDPEVQYQHQCILMRIMIYPKKQPGIAQQIIHWWGIHMIYSYTRYLTFHGSIRIYICGFGMYSKLWGIDILLFYTWWL